MMRRMVRGVRPLRSRRVGSAPARQSAKYSLPWLYRAATWSAVRCPHPGASGAERAFTNSIAIDRGSRAITAIASSILPSRASTWSTVRPHWSFSVSWARLSARRARLDLTKWPTGRGYTGPLLPDGVSVRARARPRSLDGTRLWRGGGCIPGCDPKKLTATRTESANSGHVKDPTRTGGHLPRFRWRRASQRAVQFGSTQLQERPGTRPTWLSRARPKAPQQQQSLRPPLAWTSPGASEASSA